MRKALALAIFWATIACLPAFAQVGMPWPGPGTAHSAGGATFTGVGDTVSGAKGHWGVIAYSAATRGHNMLRLCDSAGANCVDVASDATTGIVSSTQTVGGNVCNTSTHQCLITTFYDDSGANFCSGAAACNLVQATAVSMPTFVPNAVGTIPGWNCNSFFAQTTSFTSITSALTWGAGFEMTADPGANVRAVATFGDLLVGSAGLKVSNYAGTVLSSAGAATAGVFAAVIGDSNLTGGTGGISLNGARTTGSIGTAATGTSLAICADIGGGSNLNGQEVEAWIYNSQLTTGNIISLTSTMRTNGGY